MSHAINYLLVEFETLVINRTVAVTEGRPTGDLDAKIASLRLAIGKLTA